MVLYASLKNSEVHILYILYIHYIIYIYIYIYMYIYIYIYVYTQRWKSAYGDMVTWFLHHRDKATNNPVMVGYYFNDVA